MALIKNSRGRPQVDLSTARGGDDPAIRSAPAWVLSRQRTLRAAGFPVIVDGVWGPASQRAWNQHAAQDGPAKPIAPQVTRAERERRQAITARQATIRDAAGLATRRAAADVKRLKQTIALSTPLARIEAAGKPAPPPQRSVVIRPDYVPNLGTRAADEARETRKAIIGKSQIQGKIAKFITDGFRRNPQAAANVNLHRLATWLGDPAADFDPRKPADVLIVQTWLNNHGHQIKADGVWSQATNDALQESIKRTRRFERAAAVREITNAYYGPDLLTPGAPLPEWFPTSFEWKDTPTQGELLDLLQKGGSYASLVVKALTKQLNQPQIAWRSERHRQLVKLSDSFFGPVGASASPIARMFGTDALSDSQLFSSVYLAGHTGQSQEQLIGLRAQLRALYTARDAADFKRRVTAYIKVEDAAYKRRMLEMARDDPTFWGWALDKITAPGEYATTAGTAYAKDIKNRFEEHGWSALWRVDTDELDEPLNIKRLGYTEEEWAEAEKSFHDIPLKYRLPISIVADPLNFVGVGAISATIKGGIRLTGAGGRTLARAPGVAGSEFGLAIFSVSDDLVQFGSQDRILRAWRGQIAAKMEGVPVLDQLVTAGRFVARTKEYTSTIVRRKADQAMRGGFRTITTIKGKGRGLFQPAFSRFTADQLAKTDAPHRAMAIEELDPVVQTLREGGLSLHIDDAGSDLSSVGASLLARQAQIITNQQVHAMATRYSDDVYERALASGSDPELARWAADKEYERVRKAVGVYQKGAGDESLLDELNELVNKELDYFENVVMGDIQHQLRLWADEAGVSLFDEAGIWLGRDSDEMLALWEATARTFDADEVKLVDNPMYNKPVEPDVAERLIKSEIRRRTTSLKKYWHRRVIERGTSIAAKTLDEEIQAIEDDVRKWWKPVQVGDRILIRDTREKLEVSALYARHLEAGALGEGGVRLPAESNSEILARLGQPLPLAGGTPIENALENFAWNMGGAHKVPSAGTHVPGPTERRPVDARKSDHQKRVEKIARMRDIRDRRHIALTLAHREMMPYLLRNQGAIWHAMSLAQSKPIKYLYKTLKAALDIWVFATLPFRFAWVVRNVIDNTAKIFANGTWDPRMFLLGAKGPGKGIRSVFELGIAPMKHAFRFFDSVFGTNGAEAFTALIETFWTNSAYTIKKMFAAHDVPVPEQVIDSMQQMVHHEPVSARRTVSISSQRIEELAKTEGAEFAKRADEIRARTPQEILDEKRWLERTKDKIWDLMAARPENWSKRILYRDTYLKGIKEHGDPVRAFTEGMEAVDDVLFDYSKVLTIEDNFKFIAPFAQFWRKNTRFWVKTVTNKPWVPLAVIKFEEARQDANIDWPDWMKRYVSAKEIGDAIAVVPGLGWMGDYVSSMDFQLDPMTYLSFSPLYKAFKAQLGEENPNLPPDKQASVKFIGGFVDGLNDWGLSLNPFVRKPMEAAGLANSRAWQTVFPQTSLVSILTRKYVSERWADRVLDLEHWLFQLDLGKNPSQAVAENFEQYTRMEIAGQLARGETPNRALAEEKIRDFFVVQQIIAYFGGAYVRRATPEDIYLSKLQEEVMKEEGAYENLTQRQKTLLSVWSKRKLSKATQMWFDTYVEELPTIEAYYKQDGYAAAEKYKREHPEIIPFVEGAWRGKPFSQNYIKNVSLMMDSAQANEMYDLIDAIDPAFGVYDRAKQYLVTPELEAYWASNDTPEETKRRHLQGEYFRYVSNLQQTYFAIPEDDYDAKQGFLAQHPILERFWQGNDSASDDLQGIVNHANADLRDAYFEILGDNPQNSDWDKASAFIRQFPFIFDGTSSEDKIDKKTGQWKASAGGKGGSSARARDYVKAKKWIDYYFDLPEERKAAWLQSDAEGARLVRMYFDKWAHRKGNTQHAKDYLANKKWLDYYFGLGPRGSEARRAWLYGNSVGAKAVLAYFKKYGRENWRARMFNNAKFEAGDPEVRRRLAFWKIYFSLSPDLRPAFVAKNAERYGVFVYGQFGDKERHDRRQKWLRAAMAAGATKKAANYLFVKPLIDEYFKLTKAADKALFLRANPELQFYFDEYSNSSATGDKKLDKLVERYFKLPYAGLARSQFLQDHPEVQDYFDEKSTPAERAMHALLERYFDISSMRERADFAAKHPEIRAYFDRRKAQRNAFALQTQAFDDADPRLAPFGEQARGDIYDPAERMRQLLRQGKIDKLSPDTIETRRVRKPTTGVL